MIVGNRGRCYTGRKKGPGNEAWFFFYWFFCRPLVLSMPHFFNSGPKIPFFSALLGWKSRQSSFFQDSQIFCLPRDDFVVYIACVIAIP